MHHCFIESTRITGEIESKNKVLVRVNSSVLGDVEALEETSTHQ